MHVFINRRFYCDNCFTAEAQGFGSLLKLSFAVKRAMKMKFNNRVKPIMVFLGRSVGGRSWWRADSFFWNFFQTWLWFNQWLISDHFQIFRVLTFRVLPLWVISWKSNSLNYFHSEKTSFFDMEIFCSRMRLSDILTLNSGSFINMESFDLRSDFKVEINASKLLKIGFLRVLFAARTPYFLCPFGFAVLSLFLH